MPPHFRSRPKAAEPKSEVQGRGRPKAVEPKAFEPKSEKQGRGRPKGVKKKKAAKGRISKTSKAFRENLALATKPNSLTSAETKVALKELNTFLIDREAALKPVPETKDIKSTSGEKSNAYDVEKILQSRIKGGVKEYLVLWERYPLGEATWEPITHLEGAKELIDDFYQVQPTGPGGPSARAGRASKTQE